MSKRGARQIARAKRGNPIHDPRPRPAPPVVPVHLVWVASVVDWWDLRGYHPRGHVECLEFPVGDLPPYVCPRDQYPLQLATKYVAVVSLTDWFDNTSWHRVGTVGHLNLPVDANGDVIVPPNMYLLGTAPPTAPVPPPMKTRHVQTASVRNWFDGIMYHFAGEEYERTVLALPVREDGTIIAPDHLKVIRVLR